MIDPRQIPPEELNRLLMLLRGNQLPQQQAPDQMNPNMLAFLLKNQRPTVAPGMETSTVGIRG